MAHGGDALILGEKCLGNIGQPAARVELPVLGHDFAPRMATGIMCARESEIYWGLMRKDETYLKAFFELKHTLQGPMCTIQCTHTYTCHITLDTYSTAEDASQVGIIASSHIKDPISISLLANFLSEFIRGVK